LGPYELLGSIGAGGMGEVYRARDPRLSREVAIKILPAQFAADPERLRRFEQEARAAAALSHPNILAIYDIGAQANGSPYIVTELLEGDSLRDRLRSGPLPLRKAVDYASQIARGLAACSSTPGRAGSRSWASKAPRSATFDQFWIIPEHNIRETLAKTEQKIGRAVEMLKRAA
jgi:serine/threonine protein kinase